MTEAKKAQYGIGKILVGLLLIGLLFSARLTSAYPQQIDPPFTLAPAPAEPDSEQTTNRVAAPSAFSPVDTTDRAAVVAHHNSQYVASNTAIGWTGNYASCTRGTTSQAYRDEVFQQVNYFRRLAGVQDVAENSVAAERDRVMAAAMLMSVNNDISHTPSSGTHGTCWSTLNPVADAGGAERNYYDSNLALGLNGAIAITGYMQDPGSGNTATGHRGNILAPRRNVFGTGDIPSGSGGSASNALDVFAGTKTATREVRDQINNEGIVAWPPVGYVPHQSVYSRWSFALESADFNGATVTMKRNPGCANEENIAVVVQNRNGSHGERKIVWVPIGAGAHASTGGYGTWPAPAADEVFEVTISDVATQNNGVKNFTYNVIVIDPSAAAPAAISWTGATDTDWNSCGNWSSNRAPLTIDSVTIPDVANDPVISGNARVHDITIQTGAAVTMNSGQLDVYGDWVEQGTGKFDGTGGTVEFKSTSSVSMGGSSTLPDVAVGSAIDMAAVTLNSTIDIDGNLTIESGSSLNGNNTRAANTIAVKGNWTDNNLGAGFIPGTSTVRLDGATQTVDKTISATMLSENFDAVASGLPAGWLEEAGDFDSFDLGAGHNSAIRWRNETDGYLITAPIHMFPGVTYKLDYKVATSRNWTDGDNMLSPQTLSVLLLNAPSAASLAQTLAAPASETAQVLEQRSVSNITVTTAGTYYLAFRAQQTGDDYAWFDDIVLSGVSKMTFNDLLVARGASTFAKELAVAGDLTTQVGAKADFGSNSVTVEGSVTNDGAVQMTKPAASGLVEYHIKDANGTIKYYGAEVTPTGGSMGDTTVWVHGAADCLATTPGNVVQRCYEISPTTQQAATVRLYYRSAEANSNVAPKMYHNNSGTWDLEPGAVMHAGSGDGFYTEVAGVDQYSRFTLSDNAPNAAAGSVPTAPPEVSIADKSVGEGDTNAVVVVSLSAIHTSDVTVNYATSNGTATAGQDYTAKSDTLTIQAGQMSGTISIAITDDPDTESAETFNITLTSPTNATLDDAQAVVTITDNDVPPPTVSIADKTVSEGDGNITVTVSLSKVHTTDVTVDYATSDDTATAGQDYTAKTDTLTIAAGQTSGTITIAITDDSDTESAEKFNVTLSNPSNATLADSSASVTIVDNETYVVFIPIATR